jgi:hypothetical protein
MIDGRIVRPRWRSERSESLVSLFGRHNCPNRWPNYPPLDPDERIPYTLTDLGRAEVAAFRESRLGRQDCQHPRRKYDKVDQLLACDDCGEVWEIAGYEGGYPVPRKPR